MIKLVFPRDSLTSLATRFRQEPRESFAIILAWPAKLVGRNWRLLVDSVNIPADADYELRTETAVRASPAFRLLHEKRARREGLSLIYCHSHPREAGSPVFSGIDDATEMLLAAYCRERVPKIPHAALVLSPEGARARVLGCGEAIEILEIGRRLIRWFPTDQGPISNEHDRQVRAFGEAGQRAIQAMRVGLVGLGGTGSVAAQQLAHFGLSRFLLIDPQLVEDTNLNRLVGALPSDIGQPKVAIARRMIRRIVANAQVRAVQGNVLDEAVGALLRDVDFVFCCTDSHGSRHFINQLAYQYFIPCIDMGVVIQVHEGTVTHFSGRVQMLAPGLGCLVCTVGLLDPREVRWDLSNEQQRKADPYFLGRTDIKQPAVISLNSAVASQAVTMFLAAVAGIPSPARSQLLRGERGDMRVLDDTPRPQCVNCSTEAFYGKGGRYKLPVRMV
jgi:molybdopterin-synthase adenylyltransferase